MAAIDARDTLEVGGERYEIHRLGALAGDFDVARLPYSMKVLLENLLRHNDGVRVTDDDVAAVARWDGRPAQEGEREIGGLVEVAAAVTLASALVLHARHRSR